jgi:hypothetical protein
MEDLQEGSGGRDGGESGQRTREWRSKVERGVVVGEGEGKGGREGEGLYLYISGSLANLLRMLVT